MTKLIATTNPDGTVTFAPAPTVKKTKESKTKEAVTRTDWDVTGNLYAVNADGKRGKLIATTTTKHRGVDASEAARYFAIHAGRVGLEGVASKAVATPVLVALAA